MNVPVLVFISMLAMATPVKAQPTLGPRQQAVENQLTGHCHWASIYAREGSCARCGYRVRLCADRCRNCDGSCDHSARSCSAPVQNGLGGFTSYISDPESIDAMAQADIARYFATERANFERYYAAWANCQNHQAGRPAEAPMQVVMDQPESAGSDSGCQPCAANDDVDRHDSGTLTYLDPLSGEGSDQLDLEAGALISETLLPGRGPNNTPSRPRTTRSARAEPFRTPQQDRKPSAVRNTR